MAVITTSPRIDFLIFSIFLLTLNLASCCRKVPSVPQHGPKSSGDNGYRLFLADEPESYEPGKIYNLFLLGSRTHTNLQQFTKLMITAQAATETGNGGFSVRNSGPRRVGRFQPFSDSLAKFHDRCVNTVIESDDFPKSEVQVLWVAPAAGSGCVSLSAMVYEESGKWFADNGQLKKVICEQKAQKKLESIECCACDQAEYNFVFEGIWSNETHPKDFPFTVWLTHFSDVIGASHDSNFTFWGENHIASDAFRSLAEWGSVRLLEVELRAKAPRLKSLIKAAGLWYPDVNKNTSSNFRVDRKKHKVSLVSMFGPSPDWVVGVSGLNLCKTDCTWEESIDVDLYPWDSGTDSGISYMSPNAETQPRERMRRITTMYPEDPRAPFYDPNATEIPPLAKLYIRREKVISRNCDFDLESSSVLHDTENSEGPVRAECEASEWTNWTPCSVSCGKGIRTRSRTYRDPVLAGHSKCDRQLISREMCVADLAECFNNGQFDDADEDRNDLLFGETGTQDERGEGTGVCQTFPWTGWSQCSSSCGAGITMRTRAFVNHLGTKKCPHITVVEKQKCMTPECSPDDIEIPDPQCPVGPWSDWSPCSVSCGKGVEIRKRLLLVEPEMVNFCSRKMKLDEQRPCAQQNACIWTEEETALYCRLPSEAGPCRGSFTRFAYNESEKSCITFTYGGCRGNNNNFLTHTDCMESCGSIQSTTLPSVQPQQRCVLSAWNAWSTCSATCGVGKQTSHRFALRSTECPPNLKLTRHRSCYAAPCTN